MAEDGSGPSLHDFMSANRDQLLTLALVKIKEKGATGSDEDILAGTPEVFDEIVKALRRHAGVSAESAVFDDVAGSAGRSRAEHRQRVGLVAYGIGAISASIGELGARKGLRFAAAEYQVFNESIDESTADAIEEYERYQRERQDFEHSKRVGFLAHEIRNSLASAVMAYTTLQRGVMGINSKTGSILGRSLASIENLIRQTLAAVQLEAGAPIDFRRIDIVNLARQLESSAVVERGVTVRFEVAERLEVTGDERLLMAAGTNLLQNAIKFSRTGGQITVRARREAEKVLLEFEDECGGLPPASEESLLTPFTQLGDDRRGLGLGLSIVREAIEVQNGELRITNLPGKGCIFCVRLAAKAK
jgi:signal transduction histidine kinase